MPEITIRTVGDFYKLFKECEEFQKEVDEVQEEYKNCNYDPCGYMQGKVLDAKELRDAFFEQAVKFK